AGARRVGALLAGIQIDRDRVNAVAETRRAGPIVEDVAQVTATPPAQDLGPQHAVATIRTKRQVSDLHRLGEAGPSAVRVELCLGGEKRVAASGTVVGAVAVSVDVLSGERALRGRVSQHLVLLGS